MADHAFQRKYRTETIKGYEKNKSLTMRLVTTEADIQAKEATFLVADSGGASAVTRGLNGRIPSRPDNLNQFTAVLEEWHDVVERTRFNIYTSQGDGRKIMQQTTHAVINRKCDEIIYDELGLGTQSWNTGGAASVATLALILRANAQLGQNSVLNDGGGNNVGCIITPAFHAKLMELDQFSSHDYVKDTKFNNVGKDRAFSWLGRDWVVDEALPGAGTANAKCFMFHKTSIGCAVDSENMQCEVDYDRRDDFSWARCSIFMGAKLLQNSGIIIMNHDDAVVIG